MPDPRRQLAAVAYAANLDLDRLYAALPDAVDALVRRHATRDADGRPVLSPLAVVAVLAGLRALLARIEAPAAEALARRVAEAERLAARQVAAAAEREPEPVAPIVAAGAILAALARGHARAVGQAGRVLTAGAASGASAADLAGRLRAYVSPWAAPRRLPTGRRVRADRVRGAWPARPGMASAPARSLAAQTIVQAHGDRLTALAQRYAGMGVLWLLAPGHVDADDCDANADRDVGHGPGLYPPALVPDYPTHPGCRCTLAPVPLAPVAI